MNFMHKKNRNLLDFNDWVVEHKPLLDSVEAYIREFDPSLLCLATVGDIYYYLYLHTTGNKCLHEK